MSKVQEMQSKMWESVVEKMIVALEAGVSTGKWKQPWTTALHKNAITDRAYNGGNALRLMFSGEECPFWATPRQWLNAGYDIAGSKCTGMIYSPGTREKVSDDGSKTVKIFVPQIYLLMNGSYVRNKDGSPYAWKPANVHPELPEVAAFLSKHSPEIVHNDATSAYYSPSRDLINMPPLNSFTDNVSYYSVLAHELIHWTAPRVKRDASQYSKDIKARAFEELVAEFGAAIVGSQIGLSTDVRDDHLQYLASWLKALKEDKDVLRRAVSEASTAVTYLNKDVE